MEKYRNEGVQDTPPQNILLWYDGHFKQKEFEKQSLSERFSNLPFSA